MSKIDDALRRISDAADTGLRHAVRDIVLQILDEWRHWAEETGTISQVSRALDELDMRIRSLQSAAFDNARVREARGERDSARVILRTAEALEGFDDARNVWRGGGLSALARCLVR